MTHFKALEDESNQIFREVAAEFDNLVMLYSVVKDSSVLLHLSRKAFLTIQWRPIERLPSAKLFGETSIMMLVHPTLTAEEMDKSCAVLAEVLKLASGD